MAELRYGMHLRHLSKLLNLVIISWHKLFWMVLAFLCQMVQYHYITTDFLCQLVVVNVF